MAECTGNCNQGRNCTCAEPDRQRECKTLLRQRNEAWIEINEVRDVLRARPTESTADAARRVIQGG